jgi:hypothetical protein
MKILDIIKLTQEAERYPALLAWYQHTITANGEPDMAYAVRCLGDVPEEEGVDIFALYDRYLTCGEVGSAQFLIRRYQKLDPAKTIHRKAQLTQQINETLLYVREGIVELLKSNPIAGQDFVARLDNLCNDSLLTDYRPGLVLQELCSIHKQIQEALINDKKGHSDLTLTENQ